MNLKVRLRIYASLGSWEADSEMGITLQGYVSQYSWSPPPRRSKGERQDSGNVQSQQRPQMTPRGALRLGWPFRFVLVCGEEAGPFYLHVAPGRRGLGQSPVCEADPNRAEEWAVCRQHSLQLREYVPPS